MLQYHEYGDVTKPTCVSPFFRAAPSSHTFALGHAAGVGSLGENEQQARNRRLGNCAIAETSVEAYQLKQKSDALGTILAQGAGDSELANPRLCNHRGHAHTTSQGSPYPGDNIAAAKASALSRVNALQSALQNETKGLAKCY
jgi:hypothetical protein